MKSNVKWLGTIALVVALGFNAGAADQSQVAVGEVTATTACGNTYTFKGSSVSVESTSSNGVTTSKVYVDGKLMVTDTCESSSTPSESPFDLCKFVPWFCNK